MSEETPDSPSTEPVERGNDDAATPGPGFRPERERRIGHFRLIRLLGRGGMGEVYLAQDLKLKRKVALKLLSGRLDLMHPDTRDKMMSRFEREAEVASRLDHPGICSVYEFGDDDGLPWIAMQLIDGESLDHRIAKSRERQVEDFAVTHVDLEAHTTPVEEEGRGPKESSETPSSAPARPEILEIVQLMEGAARGLHAAHEEGLVHRDIKPGNIMVTAEGRAVLMDFGLVHDERGDGPQLTMTGDFMGTPAYMSPEQLAANRINIDRRSDVYSLGVTLFECLSLTRPFEAPTREGLYRKISFEDPPPLRKLNTAVPKDLAVICERSMEKNPDRRYQTALDLAEDLRRFRSFEPIQARPVSQLTRFIRWTQRSPVVASLSAALVLFLASGFAWTAIKNRELDSLNSDLDARNLDLSNKTTEALSNLAEARRMADVKLVAEATAALDDLWPLGSALIPRIAEYEATYGDLFNRLPMHEAALHDLESRAVPYDDAARLADHGPALARLAILKTDIKELEAELETDPPAARFDALEDEISVKVKEAGDLEDLVSERKTWRFAGETAEYDTWRREVLGGLVAQLRTLADERAGARPALADRRLKSQDLVRETLKATELPWRQCSARVLANPKYAVLTLSPQEGLIPLGPNPESSFEEFLHWASHAEGHPIPQRDAAGKLPAVDGETGVILVLLPGGTFMMGATHDPAGPNPDRFAKPDEMPPHEVTLSPFFLGKFEVTWPQWARLRVHCLSSNKQLDDSEYFTAPSFHVDRQPIEAVSWTDCEYTLSRSGLTLPTEARWEYGCRAGSSSIWSCGDDPNEVDNFGFLVFDSNDLPATNSRVGSLRVSERQPGAKNNATYPVGMFLANRFGLHDMLGNATEWCLDRYAHYRDGHAAGDGVSLTRHQSARRVIRGGRIGQLMYARSAARYYDAESIRGIGYGVRAARSITP